MSLLMDALKRAEESKRAGQQGAAGTDISSLVAAQQTAPDPRPKTDQIPQGLPDLPLKLEQLDEQFAARLSRPPAFTRPGETAPTRPESPPPAAAASPAPVAVSTASTDASRNVAQNVFAAKQPSRTSHGAGIAIGVATLVAIGAIGVYFWLQLRPVPRASMGRPMAAVVAETPAQPEPTASPATVAKVQRPQPAPPLRTETARPPSVAARPPEPESPIRIASSAPKVNPAVADAYEAFQSGDVPRAARGYEQALQADPHNADALLGSAAIALRQGRNLDAESHYLRLLETDPGNAAAQAGLQGLRATADPVAAETRLKSMLAEQPDAPSLRFALGNLYARQNRWSDAQQEYFRAVTGDADNPDYLFNLAVSLDQLRQPRLAAQYYRQALTAAGNRSASFDQGKAAARLRDMQP